MLLLCARRCEVLSVSWFSAGVSSAVATKLAIDEVIGKFPWGVSGIQRVKDTFRTTVGRQYGPEFIDLGVQIGKEIFQYLQRHIRDLRGEGEGSRIEMFAGEAGRENE